MCTIIHSFLVLNNNHNNVILFKFLDYHRIFRTFVKDAKDSSYFCCCALLGDIFFFVCFCFYFYTFSIGFLKPCYRLFLFFILFAFVCKISWQMTGTKREKTTITKSIFLLLYLSLCYCILHFHITNVLNYCDKMKIQIVCEICICFFNFSFGL